MDIGNNMWALWGEMLAPMSAQFRTPGAYGKAKVQPRTASARRQGCWACWGTATSEATCEGRKIYVTPMKKAVAFAAVLAGRHETIETV